MPTVPDIHRKGTRAAQPAPGAVTVGTLYFVTDEQLTERSTGSAWESYGGGIGATGPTGPTGPVGPPGTAPGRTITLSIDGGGAAITPGIKGYLRCPAGTIAGWTLLADQAGSIVIDVWKDTFSNYPPTVADTITASAKPTLAGADKAENATLTGWIKTIAAGDVLAFNVDSAAAVTRVVLELTLAP